MENNKIKTFYIPVEWTVWDKIPVQATSIEEAVDFVKNHLDDIPLGTEPEYLDDSYRICEDDDLSVDELVCRLKECWDLSGGISGEDCDFTVMDLYEEYKRNWCEERGYQLEDIDEEIGINGECYSCFDEFVQNDLIYFVNKHLI